jgi:hypothetical protein
LRIEGLPGAVHGAIAARAIHWFVPTMGPLGAWLTCGDVRVEDADATPLPVMFARVSSITRFRRSACAAAKPFSKHGRHSLDNPGGHARFRQKRLPMRGAAGYHPRRSGFTKAHRLDESFRMRAWGQGWTLVALVIAAEVLIRLTTLRFGIELYDEGYLWQGAVATSKGAVPLRDFAGYDPGRYWWVAALMGLGLGKSIVAMRLALVPLETVAIYLSLRLVADRLRELGRQSAETCVWLGLGAVILLITSFKIFHVADGAIALFTLAAVYRFLRNPDVIAQWLLGVMIGLAAVWGRNHGVYASVAAVLALGLLALQGIRLPLAGFARIVAGGVIGYAPILAMMAFSPGFATSFIASVTVIFARGSTNMAVPIPWPWTLTGSGLHGWALINRAVVSGFITATIAYPLAMIGWIGWRLVQRQTIPPALVAPALVALPYAHYALSRAEQAHFARAGLPMLVGLLILVAGIRARAVRWLMGGALLLAVMVAQGSQNPAWWCMRYHHCHAVALRDTTVWLSPWDANLVGFVFAADAHFAANGAPVLALPYLPGAYPMLQKPSPLWDNYPTWAVGPDQEHADIARIEHARPPLLLFSSRALDKDPTQRFARTHPLTNAYLAEHYQRTALHYYDDVEVWTRRARP